MTDQHVQRALQRAALLRLLGGAWLCPTEARLEELAGLAGRVAETSPGSGLCEALEKFAEAARSTAAPAAADEYVFLFDRQVRCSPYEGAYGDGPQLAGKSAALADIAGFYTAFGLGPAEARPDMEDHIGAELEFMSALALKEAWAIGEGDDEGSEVIRRAQTAFLGDHLGRWAEKFAQEVVEATPLPYYAAAADLLRAWVRTEIEALGASPTTLSARLPRDPLQDDAFTCPMAD